MEIYKDRDQVVYYHKGIEDLLKNEDKFKSLEIGLGYFDNSKIRICPRTDHTGEYELIWHILLLNTGDKTKDFEILRSALGRFKREFREEL